MKTTLKMKIPQKIEMIPELKLLEVLWGGWSTTCTGYGFCFKNCEQNPPINQHFYYTEYK